MNPPEIVTPNGSKPINIPDLGITIHAGEGSEEEAVTLGISHLKADDIRGKIEDELNSSGKEIDQDTMDAIASPAIFVDCATEGSSGADETNFEVIFTIDKNENGNEVSFISCQLNPVENYP